MMRSSARHNHTNNDINKSRSEMEIEKERGGGLSLLEGDAQNIAAYKLVLELGGDPFVIGYHAPQGVGW